MKILRGSLVIPLLVLLLSSGVASQGCGDCDGNGGVAVTDSLIAAQDAAGIISLGGGAARRCDVDADGSITALDSLVLAQWAIGLVPPLGCEPEWIQEFPATRPAARSDAAMTYDAGRRVSVLFGGQDALGSTRYADTWEWDGAAWTERYPATSPSGRSGHAMAYDSGRGVTVLFGGSLSAAAVSDETWEWDGVDWLRRFPAMVPRARAGCRMTHDARRQVMVMWGGYPGFGPVGQYLLVWEWDGVEWRSSWPMSSPAERSDQGMAFDTSRGDTIMFGGFRIGPATLDDTWAWDGTAWEERFPVTRPADRQSAAMVWSPLLQRVLLFGGIGRGVPPQLLNDTWVYDGTDWAQLITAAAPSPRLGMAAAYDTDRDALVIFGGQDAPALDETWELR